MTDEFSLSEFATFEIDIKGQRYSFISNQKFEVVIARKSDTLELYIRPLNRHKAVITTRFTGGYDLIIAFFYN